MTPGLKETNDLKPIVGTELRKVSLKQIGFYALQSVEEHIINASFKARDIYIKMGFKDGELYKAVADNRMDQIAKLLAEGVDPSAPSTTRKSRPPLFDSVENHQDEITKVLLNATLRKDPSLIDHRDASTAETFLHVAAYNENWTAYKMGLSKRPSPDMLDGGLQTPSMIVARVGDFSLLQETFNKGANPLHLDADGLPLAAHVIMGSSDEKLKMLELLKAHGLDFSKKYGPEGRNLLSFAAEHGDVEIVKFILEQPGVNVNAESRSGLSPLHYAVINDEKIVKELLDAGAQPNVFSKGNPEKALIAATPLMVAAGHGEFGSVNRLAQDPRTNLSLAVPGTDLTASSIASSRGHHDIATFLGAKAEEQIRNAMSEAEKKQISRAQAALNGIDQLTKPKASYLTRN
jgi:ankyrin repeat protein